MKRKRSAGATVDIVTVPVNKRYRISFFKRRRMNDHSSVSLGYIQGCTGGESRVTVRPSMGDDLKFKHPFSCLLSGPSSSGMMSFCIRFLENLKQLCTLPYYSGGIVWCYCEICAIHCQKLTWKKHVRFREGVPAVFNNSGEKPCLIFLVD